MADSVGMQDIRGLNVDKAVTGFALREYKFKQLVSVVPTSDWQDRYYQETALDKSTGTGASVEGVPRLAVFPYAETTWTQQNAYMKKYGNEVRISYEDSISNDVDVISRELLRTARVVTKAVDAEIWDTLTESRTVVNINSVTIPTGDEWDSATIANRDPIKDILAAKQAIYEQDYNPDSNGFLVLNPKDYKNLLSNANIRNAGQFYTDSVTRNGNVGSLLGLKVIVSNNVTTGYAAVIIAKECGTWKQLTALRTVTITDAGIGYTIRSFEIGSCQLRNPKAVCLIINTDV